MVRSYPSEVRRFQIGGLNSSLGVSEPSCTLGIMYQMQIGSLGMAIKDLGGLVTCQLNHVQLSSFESRTSLWIL